MLFVLALVLFFALHTLPFRPTTRARILQRWGERGYKIRFRLSALLIVALGIYAWSDMPAVYWYEPPLLFKQIHLFVMMPAVFFWVIAEIPNNFRRPFRHPMLIGTIIWGCGHTLANGDSRSLLLFISLTVFSILGIRLANLRDRDKVVEKREVVHRKFDALAMAISVSLYLLIVQYHGALFGMPIKHYFS